jgi:hypothetical protein
MLATVGDRGNKCIGIVEIGKVHQHFKIVTFHQMTDCKHSRGGVSLTAYSSVLHFKMIVVHEGTAQGRFSLTFEGLTTPIHATVHVRRSTPATL